MSNYSYQLWVKYPEQLKIHLASFSTLDYIVVEDTTTTSTTTLYFSSTLTSLEETALDNAITAWTNPPTAPTHLQVTRKVTVSQDGLGTDFSSIIEAISFANSWSGPIDIVLHAGTYSIGATTLNITNTYGISLASLGGKGTCIVTGTSTLVNVNTVGNVHVAGISFTGGPITFINGQGKVTNSSFSNYTTTAISAEAGYMQISNCDFQSGGNVGIQVGNAQVFLKETTFTSVPEAIATTDPNSDLTITNCTIQSSSTSALTLDGGRCTIRASTITSCANGITINEADFLMVSDSEITNTTTWCLEILTSVPEIALKGVVLDQDKISNPQGSTITGDTQGLLEGVKRKKVIYDDTTVGARLVVGQGTSTIPDSAIMGNDYLTSGNWTIFPATSAFVPYTVPLVDACVYIGHVTTFAGLHFTLTTNATLENGTFEYYNGTSWQEIGWMVVDVSTTETLGKDLFIGTEGEKYVFFGLHTNWTQQTLNGKTMYFIRYRFLGGGAQYAVELQSPTPVLSTTVTERNGFNMKFGQARGVQLLPLLSRTSWTLHTYGHNENSYYATTLVIPTDLDTSCPIKFTWTYRTTTPSSTGDIVWRMRYTTLDEGDQVSDNPSATWFTTPNDLDVQVISTVSAGQEQKLKKETCLIHLGGKIQGKHILSIELTRLGTNVLNTLNTSVQLINTQLKYVTWTDGVNISQF